MSDIMREMLGKRISELKSKLAVAEGSVKMMGVVIEEWRTQTDSVTPYEARRKLDALAEARNTFGKIDNHMEEGRSYPAEWWNELRKALGVGDEPTQKEEKEAEP